jgi:hypothetical protein
MAMKKLFEALLDRAKEIENKCKKDPIEFIDNKLMNDFYLQGKHYKISGY